jgi:hypothetical protein
MMLNLDQKPSTVFRRTVVLVLAIVGICSGQSTWEWMNPLPQGNCLYCVIYADSQYCAVGMHGTIATSPDGVVWTQKKSGTTDDLCCVAYGNGTYVAVGWKGAVVNSSDGDNWTISNSGTVTGFMSVTFGNGRFVAVGGSGVILVSQDGMHWAKKSSGLTYNFTGVTYGGGLFVAVNEGGKIVTSPDGDVWTVVHSAAIDTVQKWFTMVTYAEGRFIAEGFVSSDRNVVCTSQDGATWTLRNTSLSNTPTSMAVGNGMFAAVVGHTENQKGAIAETSTPDSGGPWTQVVPGAISNLYSITYGSGQFVAVGAFFTIVTSADGASWTIRSPVFNHKLPRQIACCNNQFVAVSSYGSLMTSPDGETWAITDSIDGAGALASGNNKFVAIGPSATLLTSSDGQSWVKTNSSNQYILTDVAFGNGLFVAVRGTQSWPTYNEIFTSADGMKWKKSSAQTGAFLHAVTFGNGRFVIVGAQGATMMSPNPDSVDWSVGSLDTRDNLESVVYGNNGFVAVGSRGSIFTSPDGMNWKVAMTDTTKSFTSVTYGDSQYVAVGIFGAICVSPDAAMWSFKESGTGDHLYTVTYYKDRFIASGEGGIVLYSHADTLAVQKDTRRIPRAKRFRLQVNHDCILAFVPFSSSRANVSAKIFSCSGKTVYTSFSRVNNGVVTIPNEALPAGIYYMSIVDEYDERVSAPFVVAK